MRNYQSFQPMAALVAAVAIGVSATHVAATEARIARYSETALQPSDVQRDPLLSLVQSRVPKDLLRVDEAVDWLLQPSGYRLASSVNASPERSVLLALPLPEVHRSLEGLPLRQALQTLAGAAFTLVEDPAHRLVSFQPCGASREGH
jgi:type IV pili sensor histidine kinase/response regulator